MIERLTAIQFDRRASNGRTSPAFITCEDREGEPIEVIAKLSGGCDLGETSLAMEVVCACLAGDLGLPIPTPYLVVLHREWIDSIIDQGWADVASRSSPIAFGSKRLPAGFGPWLPQTSMLQDMLSKLAAVLLFDMLIDNPDRRRENPNCLLRGDEIRIIDHELALTPVPMIGWRPPWHLGALHNFERPGAHIFRDALHGRVIDWTDIAARWSGLSDGAVADYEAAIPSEWSSAIPAVRRAIEKIINARDHIEGCVVEVQRLLT